MTIVLKQIIHTLFSLIIFSYTVMAAAQTQQPKVKITSLTQIDKKYLKEQAERINTIAHLHLGTEIHQDKTDLILLQRLVDKNLIPANEIKTWQAAGVVLGNVYIAELKGLQWYIYEDGEGRSRAVCVPDTTHCLFPVTMISRRIEADAPVDVQAIYQGAYTLIEAYVAKVNTK